MVLTLTLASAADSRTQPARGLPQETGRLLNVDKLHLS